MTFDVLRAVDSLARLAPAPQETLSPVKIGRIALDPESKAPCLPIRSGVLRTAIYTNRRITLPNSILNWLASSMDAANAER